MQKPQHEANIIHLLTSQLLDTKLFVLFWLEMRLKQEIIAG